VIYLITPNLNKVITLTYLPKARGRCRETLHPDSSLTIDKDVQKLIQLNQIVRIIT